jgi:membrane-associated protease RseP (regulator of RpoE activity)
MAVPSDAPLIKAVYVGYPAANASILPNSVITEIDGTHIGTRSDVSSILDRTKPGDTITLEVEAAGHLSTHALTLGAWPDIPGNQSSGFMGISYYPGDSVRTIFDSFASPFGLFMVMAVPLEVILHPESFGFFIILLNDTVDTVAWSTPFPHYWFLVQVFFWCAWFNLMVALCNALPMIPLDGGYIFREGTEKLLQRFGMQKYTGHIVTVTSVIIIFVLVLVFSLPRIFELLAAS